MQSLLRPALVLFLFFTILTGFIYPLASPGIAQAVFARAASGSILMRDGKPVGSAFIGQNFSDRSISGAAFRQRLPSPMPAPPHPAPT